MTEAQLLDGQAFNRLVLENDLTGKTWEQDGYIYAGFKGVAGWELYRTYGPKWRWVWVYAQVCTQNNAGGGTLAVTVKPASGEVMKLMRGQIKASGNRGVMIYNNNSATASVLMSNISAVAGAYGSIPSIGAAASASANLIQSKDQLFTLEDFLTAQVTSAAQTETATFYLAAILTSATKPTVSWATSGGTPAVTTAAIDVVTAVLMP